MSFSIGKKFKFEASHNLPSHKGKCANKHGHSITGKVVVASDGLNENFMVIDFSDLNAILNKVIVDEYDHKDINEVFKNKNIDKEPTAEVLARLFFEEIEEELKKYPNVVLQAVFVDETEGNTACYGKEI